MSTKTRVKHVAAALGIGHQAATRIVAASQSVALGKSALLAELPDHEPLINILTEGDLRLHAVNDDRGLWWAVTPDDPAPGWVPVRPTGHASTERHLVSAHSPDISFGTLSIWAPELDRAEAFTGFAEAVAPDGSIETVPMIAGHSDAWPATASRVWPNLPENAPVPSGWDRYMSANGDMRREDWDDPQNNLPVISRGVAQRLATVLSELAMTLRSSHSHAARINWTHLIPDELLDLPERQVRDGFAARASALAKMIAAGFAPQPGGGLSCCPADDLLILDAAYQLTDFNDDDERYFHGSGFDQVNTWQIDTAWLTASLIGTSNLIYADETFESWFSGHGAAGTIWPGSEPAASAWTPPGTPREPVSQWAGLEARFPNDPDVLIAVATLLLADRQPAPPPGTNWPQPVRSASDLHPTRSLLDFVDDVQADRHWSWYCSAVMFVRSLEGIRTETDDASPVDVWRVQAMAADLAEVVALAAGDGSDPSLPDSLVKMATVLSSEFTVDMINEGIEMIRTLMFADPSPLDWWRVRQAATGRS